MKILLINNQHFRKGGAHHVYFNTAALLEKFGHEVFFFTTLSDESLPYENQLYFPKEINYKKLLIINKFTSVDKFIYNRNTAKKLETFLDKFKPDVVNVHLFMGGLTSSILKVIKQKKIPLVHTVHDYRLICPSYLFLDGNNIICEKCKSGFYTNCIINKCSKRSLSQSAILALDSYFRKYIVKPDNYIDKYIFVSRFIYDKHIEYNFTKKSKSNILHNFIPNIIEIKPTFKKGKYFIFFGRLSREKGVFTLIKAFSKINNPLLKLKIVGTGPLENELKCFVNENKIVNILFEGHKSGNELIQIIKNASFAIVPSEWYENNPMSIIEAFAYGKPVIGSKIGGIPELVKEGENGFLFNHGNEKQLKDILLKTNTISEEQYFILSKNARLFAETNFHEDIHYENLIKIYNKTIKEYRL